MKKRFIIVVTLVFTALFYMQGCSGRYRVNNNRGIVLTAADSLKIVADSLMRISKPIMGYRFKITGDFDGDHKTDVLQEHYTDSLYLKEAAKYYVSTDTMFEYSDVSFLNRYFNRQSFVEWNEKQIKLPGGQLGFHYIENCGDINDDGKDEILIVNQWDDYSSTNTAYIYTFTNGAWLEVYKTPVWEWQFPPTPSGSMIPGLFGNLEYGTTEDGADNAALEKQLKAYKFIKYYPDRSIEFSGRNAIGIFDDDEALQELEEIGDREYIKKHYKAAMINDSLYFSPIKNPSIYYKAIKGASLQDTASYLLPLDDGAYKITTRIFISHPQSPFK
ncbi:hypothetical protein Q765_02430 [Flavobacterium rivuli WB 3.3-2 = DSM 21788]|uniref:Uncharacterized protein n=1 Tax=Flavobacterium rivuli WB 3.3-2 = DSM 21788 TaxID=1121895 RepID=A0A0A2MI00_9FLAO|nr:hypothetical protein [Flavobacterium rivuli]KGO87950.1 hypothetical protein Q765_02430 [Flavobacterium rivuli WB 3.3-2 = DSM 21788]